VIHLDAIAGVSSYYSMPLKTLQVNILGTVNMLEAAVAVCVKQVIYFSTSEVYGSNAMNVTEQDPHGIGPTSDKRWVYATSKLAGENFVLRYGEEYGFAATCLRPFNVYGPRQTGEGAISNFCIAALNKEQLTVYGDGSAVRAWCYVSDMVDAVVLALTRPESVGHSFNIGNPREAETTNGLARRVAALVPGSTIRRQPMDRAEVAVRLPRIDKARQLLGFEPSVDLDEGLKRTLAWYQEGMKA
jgi:nucleoside-diphosphate-sugar epimerase